MGDRTAMAPLSDLPLFEGSAPSVPTRSSENAADFLSSRWRTLSCRRILFYLLELPADEYRSMAEIGRDLGIPVNVVCARMDDLQWSARKEDGTRAPSGYIDRAELVRVSLAKPSLHVDGFRIAESRRAVVAEAQRKSKGVA